MRDAGDDAQMMEMDDPVPVITRKHFEEAFQAARKSVTAYDLSKFEAFRKKYDAAYAAKVGGSSGIKINWQEAPASQFGGGDDEDDDDLYK